MKILYIDPVFGISGDMMISALIDAGLPFEEVARALKAIPDLPAIEPVKVRQGVLGGVRLDIAPSDLHLHVREMIMSIDGLPTAEKVREDAKGMLDIIVEAESKVHGVPKDKVHLHELSHIDTLIDVVAVAVGVNFFGIDKVYSGPIPHGRGTITTAHGIMPNPPPATIEILGGYAAVFRDVALELTTPTGAAIVRHYAEDQIGMPPLNIQRTGCGLGSYKTDMPDVLRIFIGEAVSALSSDRDVWIIETDLDDMEMEYMGAVSEKMRKEGALDVLCFPVYMKKGRIGLRLSVVSTEERLNHLVGLVFSETTTFGMRLRKEQRRVLKREEKVFESSLGQVRVKYGFNEEGKLVKTHIEFDDARKISDEQGVPYRKVFEVLKRELQAFLDLTNIQ